MAKKSNKTDHVLSLLSSGGKEKTEPVVSVVQPSAEKEGLAETIKKSLEEELESAHPEPESVEEVVLQEPEPLSEPAEEILLPEPEPEPESEPEPEPKPEPKPEPIPEPVQEEDFAVVNVMEFLVKEKAVKYMEQFGNCTCSRCVADTVALALTHLPPKYMVVNKETVAPLMNFYMKMYAGQITVEITKACIRVAEYPRHDRE